MPEQARHYAEHWQRLQADRQFRLKQLEALREATAPTPPHDEVNRLLRLSATAALLETETALARMAEGRYGLCRRCGRQIDADRLDVLPRTSTCAGCLGAAR